MLGGSQGLVGAQELVCRKWVDFSGCKRLVVTYLVVG